MISEFVFDKYYWYWQLNDNTVWGTSEADFVDESIALAWAQERGMSKIPPSPNDENGEANRDGLYAALLFYDLPLGTMAKQLDKIEAIQEKYKPILNELLQALTAATALGDEDDIADCKADYTTELDAMTAEIQAVPAD